MIVKIEPRSVNASHVFRCSTEIVNVLLNTTENLNSLVLVGMFPVVFHIVGCIFSDNVVALLYHN